MDEANEPGDLPERVRRAVRRVPPGTVVTYGDIAELVDTGPRQVGRIMATDAADTPWWRVVNAEGRISNAYGPELQRAKLIAEGVAVSADLRLDLAAYDAEELVFARLSARRSQRPRKVG